MGQAFSAFKPTGSHFNRHFVGWEQGGRYWLATISWEPSTLQTEHLNVRDRMDNPSVSLQEWMESHSDLQDIKPRPFAANEYHPRIYRPGAQPTIYRSEEPGTIIEQSAVAIEILIDRMHHLFRVVEPCEQHLAVYGHEIRNLLLLACMEVEASWAAVLTANGYTTATNRFSTNDYVKLLRPMHLSEYRLAFSSYPMFPWLSPFCGWASTVPTQSLPWYNAYNETKHNREQHFDSATLGHALNSVAAAVIMFLAQFGSLDTEHD